MPNFFQQQRELLLRDIRNASGYALCERYAWAVDRAVLDALDGALADDGISDAARALPSGWSLMALGGYGRQEMCLRSDVDIQLLIPDDADDPAPLMERFIGRLMNVGFRLGHGVRTRSEALALARDEPTFATAMSSARHLAGDPTATDAARVAVYQHLAGPGLASLIACVRDDRARRTERLGDTVYVLEPDLKAGIGGLRDAHLIRWLALVTGRTVDRRLAFAEDLLLRVRQCLHAHVTFKSDRLSFEYQDLVAAQLSLNSNDEEAVLALMRDVHRAMKVIASRARRALELAADRISPPVRTPLAAPTGFTRIGNRLGRASGVVPRTIDEAVTLLAAVRDTALPLEASLETALEDLSRFVAETTPWTSNDPALAAMLVELLADPGQGASLALKIAHRTGLLIAFVPEFEPVVGRLQRDLYHVFTVDEHTLRAVDQLKALARGDLPDLGLATERVTALARRPEAMRLLAIAVFLHDVGKGYGARHHERSAEVAMRVGPRFGLSPHDVERVCLLVRHQADMPLVCLRRDLGDPRPIRHLARIVGDLETLDMLYLLSVVDWSSVGPQTFSPWQRTLLDTLYLRVSESLDHDALFSDPTHLTEHLRAELLVGELGNIPEAPSGQSDAIDDFCAALPTRYFQTVDAARMRADFRLWQRFQATSTPCIEVRQSDQADQADQAIVAIVCADSPGALARITAGFAAARLSVIGAEIFSLAGGSLLDIFRVADPHGRLRDERPREQLQVHLSSAIAAETPAPAPARRAFDAHQALPPVAPSVQASNDVATDHTVFDVSAGDRPGLLADIAAFFHRHALSVEIAFAATEGRVVRDSFYVLTDTHAKVDDHQLAGLAQGLTEALAPAADGP